MRTVTWVFSLLVCHAWFGPVSSSSCSHPSGCLPHSVYQGLSHATSVAITSSNTLLIADCNHGRIVETSLDGKLIDIYHFVAYTNPTSDIPPKIYAVATDQKGGMYASIRDGQENSQGYLFKFNHAHEQEIIYNTTASQPYLFGLWDMTVDEQQHKLYATNPAYIGAVVEFSTSGGYLNSFSVNDSSIYTSQVWGIATTQDSIFVGDNQNQVIVRYNKTTDTLTQTYRTISPPLDPAVITIHDNQLIIADHTNQRIVMMTIDEGNVTRIINTTDGISWKAPMGVTLAPDGKMMFVADAGLEHLGGSRIVCLDMTTYQQIPYNFPYPNLYQPSDIAFQPHTDIMWVADRLSSRLVQMDPYTGAMIREISHPDLPYPRIIAISHDGSIMYVVVTPDLHDAIVTLSSDGTVEPFHVNVNVTLHFVRDILVDDVGHVYISSWDCNCVMKCDPMGNVLHMYNTTDGVGTVGGMDLDAEGALYVSDSGNGTVIKFDAQGNVQHRFASPLLEIPDSVVVSPTTGVVYITQEYSPSCAFVSFSSSGVQLDTYESPPLPFPSMGSYVGMALNPKTDDVFLMDLFSERIMVWGTKT